MRVAPVKFHLITAYVINSKKSTRMPCHAGAGCNSSKVSSRNYACLHLCNNDGVINIHARNASVEYVPAEHVS